MSIAMNARQAALCKECATVRTVTAKWTLPRQLKCSHCRTTTAHYGTDPKLDWRERVNEKARHELTAEATTLMAHERYLLDLFDKLGVEIVMERAPRSGGRRINYEIVRQVDIENGVATWCLILDDSLTLTDRVRFMSGAWKSMTPDGAGCWADPAAYSLNQGVLWTGAFHAR